MSFCTTSRCRGPLFNAYRFASDEKYKMHSKERQTEEEMNANFHTARDLRAFSNLGVGRLDSVQSQWMSEILASCSL